MDRLLFSQERKLEGIGFYFNVFCTIVPIKNEKQSQVKPCNTLINVLINTKIANGAFPFYLSRKMKIRVHIAAMVHSRTTLFKKNTNMLIFIPMTIKVCAKYM